MSPETRNRGGVKTVCCARGQNRKRPSFRLSAVFPAVSSSDGVLSGSPSSQLPFCFLNFVSWFAVRFLVVKAASILFTRGSAGERRLRPHILCLSRMRRAGCPTHGKRTRDGSRARRSRRARTSTPVQQRPARRSRRARTSTPFQQRPARRSRRARLSCQQKKSGSERHAEKVRACTSSS